MAFQGDELHARVARRIKAAARSKRIPLAHIADRAGVSRSHFFDVLGQRKSPTLQWLERIAVVLDADVEDFVRRSVKK